MTFGELRTRTFKAHADQQYYAALQQIDTEWPNHIDHLGDISYWRICLLSLLGRIDEALDTISSGVQAGITFPPSMLHNDPDLEVLRRDSRFDAMVERLSTIHASRIAEERLRIEFVLPSDPGSSDPAVLLFHGNNSNGHNAIAQWKPVLPASWLLAAVTGREPSHAAGAYLWSEPDARESAIHGVVEVFESQLRNRSLGVCGFSLGCTAAFDATEALSREIYLMCLAAPSINLKRIERIECFPLIQHLLVFAGEYDKRALEAGRIVTELATDEGSLASLVIVDSRGHEFPPLDLATGALEELLHVEGM